MNIVKNGFKGKKQRFLCKDCKRRFIIRQKTDKEQLWKEYIFDKQTVKQLCERYDLSTSTIRRHLHSGRTERLISSIKTVVVLMDTTYWGRNFGVVVFKDAYTKRILWRKFVKYETLNDYLEGIEWLEEHHFVIRGIVCDGLRGLFQLLHEYKVQMCQYHQICIVRRYLTNKPELEASKELLALTKTMTRINKTEFISSFDIWEAKWGLFLKERSVDKKTGKSYYAHKTLRSTYLSLKRNMSYLWTFSDYPQANIPNTNNALEGTFADLKTKLRNHNGISKDKRRIFIDKYFKQSFKKNHHF